MVKRDWSKEKDNLITYKNGDLNKEEWSSCLQIKIRNNKVVIDEITGPHRNKNVETFESKEDIDGLIEFLNNAKLTVFGG